MGRVGDKNVRQEAIRPAAWNGDDGFGRDSSERLLPNIEVTSLKPGEPCPEERETDYNSSNPAFYSMVRRGKWQTKAGGTHITMLNAHRRLETATRHCLLLSVNTVWKQLVWDISQSYTPYERGAMRKTKVATKVTSLWIPEIDFGYWALLYRASGLVDGLDLYSVWLGHSGIAIVEEY